MRARSAGFILAGAAMCAVAACRGVRMSETAEEATARQLVGAWDATFALVGSDGSTEPGTVHGTIALVQDRSGRVWSAQLSTTDEYGVYDVDFRPFGFDPRDGQGIPVAVAAVVPDSSGAGATNHVRIVLHPGDARVAVILDGVLAHDAVTGDWRTDSRTASGAGHFTLKRHVP